MDRDQLPSVVESLLFVSDGPVELTRLQRILDVEPADLAAAIETLSEASRRRGVHVQRHGDSVQLVTAPEAAPYVEKLLGVQVSGKLSTAAMETLAIIAYRQPVTRAGIEAIRGVNAERALATLLSRALISEVGRMDTAGRPILYGTTFEFLQHFGLQSVAELPALGEMS